MNNLNWLKENNGIVFIDSLYGEPALTISVNGEVVQVPLDDCSFLRDIVNPTIESMK